jgi:hypothetical protein
MLLTVDFPTDPHSTCLSCAWAPHQSSQSHTTLSPSLTSNKQQWSAAAGSIPPREKRRVAAAWVELPDGELKSTCMAGRGSGGGLSGVLSPQEDQHMAATPREPPALLPGVLNIRGAAAAAASLASSSRADWQRRHPPQGSTDQFFFQKLFRAFSKV